MGFIVGAGLDTKDADALHEQLMLWVQETYPGFPQGNFQQPFYRLPESKAGILSEYVKVLTRVFF
jgi:hypothetical protein